MTTGSTRFSIRRCRATWTNVIPNADQLLYDLEHYIYHMGYGPTNETLGRYIRELFGQTRAHGRHRGDEQGGNPRQHDAHREEESRARHETFRSPLPRSRSACFKLPALRIPRANLKKTLAAAERAARQGAKIICTQELFRSQYFCQTEDHEYFKLAESIPGPSTDAFQKLAKKHRAVIIASLFEKRASGVYHNTAAIIDADGSLLGRLSQDAHSGRPACITRNFISRPGDLGFRAWQTRYAKIGVLICWDQWYPEAARLTAMQGAEILFYPTAIGWHPAEKKRLRRAATRRLGNDPAQPRRRERLLCRRARIASDTRSSGRGGDGIEFWGQSFVAGTSGRNSRQSQRRPRTGSGRAAGLAESGRDAHTLAVPA